jgi:alpha-tubulin suppressor-like RCC1 family protein
VRVAGVTSAVPITTGGYYSCALNANGGERYWGYNGSGQLGNGSTTSRTVSVPVSSMADGARTGAGDHHTCAMLSDWSVYCWGANHYGQVGNGTHAGQSVPTAVFSFP